MARGILTLVTVAATFGAGIVSPAVAVADGVDRPYCADALVLAARGSGEGNVGQVDYTGANGQSNGWEGERIRLFLSGDDVELNGFRVSGLSDLEYEAVSVGPEDFLDRRSFNASLAQGRKAAIRRIQAMKSAGCQPVVIPIGYSQGAMVFNGVEETLVEGTYVPGVLYIGNPEREAGQARNFGTAAADVSGRLFGRSQNVVGQTGVDYCYEGDFFCDGGGTSFKAHTSYFNGYRGQAENDAKVRRWFSAWTRDAQRKIATAEVTPVTKPLEEVLLIDTTGSMTDDIDSARRNAAKIAEKVLAANPKSKIGLAEYRDWSTPFYDGSGAPRASRWVVPLTTDFDEFQRGLDSLTTSGGADEPEDLYSGLMDVFLHAEWSAGANHSVIAISDAPPHDPECVTGLTAQKIINLARESAVTVNLADQLKEERGALTSCGGAYSDDRAARDAETPMDPIDLLLDGADGDFEGRGDISVNLVTNNPYLADRVDGLFGQLGGNVYNYDGAAAADAIIDAAEADAKIPNAVLDVPSVWEPGVPADVTGMLSDVFVDGDPTYTVDYGDGAVEDIPVGEFTQHTWTAPGDYRVVLTVTDGAGNTGRDIRTVHINSAAETAAADARFEELRTAIAAAEEPTGDVPEPGGDDGSDSGSSMPGPLTLAAILGVLSLLGSFVVLLFETIFGLGSPKL
nr:cutinase family protein [Corynebacterium marambiense]